MVVDSSERAISKIQTGLNIYHAYMRGGREYSSEDTSASKTKKKK